MRISRQDPDRARIFCIGLNKTGTSSFDEAVTLLGFASLHWGGPRVREAVEAALAAGRPLLSNLDARYDAFSDIEVLSKNFVLLDEQYPGSKFILTVRPIDDWIDSRRRHVQRNVRRKEAGEYNGTFLEVKEDEWREDWYRQVSQARSYFNGRSDFLEYDIVAGLGWEPLCSLLDVPEPKTEFPWVNRTKPVDQTVSER